MKKVFFAAALALLVTTGCSISGNKTAVISIDEAKVKAADFINNNLVQKGNEVSIKEVVEEDGLYKVTVNMKNGQEIISYLTKDGKKLFPQVLVIEDVEKENSSAKAQQEAADEKQMTEVTKSDKPEVEVFVMSHCPYGTQIEKGILPVVDLLKDKINFEVKFCDYAMHGEKELKEQLTQYCIQQQDKAKLLTYLKCFLADESKSAQCLKEAKVDEGKLNTCVSATDKQYKVTENYNNKDSWVGNYPPFEVYKADNEKYDVKGSPSLVVNGQEFAPGRDSASLLKVICSAFNNVPSECSQSLSADTPSPGFGYGTADASASGGCEE